MSKASWEDTPPIRRLIARILKLVTPLPGFTAALRPDTTTGEVVLTGNAGATFNFGQSGDPEAFDYSEIYVGDRVNSPSFVDIYAEHDRPNDSYDEATVYLHSPAGDVNIDSSGNATSGYRTSVGVGTRTGSTGVSMSASMAGDGTNVAGSVVVNGVFGQPAPGVVVNLTDVEVTDSRRGVILHSPDDTKHRIKVANNGTLSTEVVT